MGKLVVMTTDANVDVNQQADMRPLLSHYTQ